MTGNLPGLGPTSLTQTTSVEPEMTRGLDERGPGDQSIPHFLNCNTGI
jgi:hypothetical protein